MVGLQRRRMTNKKVVTLKTILSPMLSSGGDGDGGNDGNTGSHTEDKWQTGKKKRTKLTLCKQIFKGSSPHKSLSWFEAYALKMYNEK